MRIIESVAYSTANLASAPMSGNGASFSIDLCVTSRVARYESECRGIEIVLNDLKYPGKSLEKGEYTGSEPIDVELVKKIIEKTVMNTLHQFGSSLSECSNFGISFDIESKIPSDSGLGFKEALINSVMLSTLGLIAGEHNGHNRGRDGIYELKIDKFLSEQFFLMKNTIVDKRKLIDLSNSISTGFSPQKTSRFDRVVGSFYGGFIVSNNYKNKIMRIGKMEDMGAVILTPEEGILNENLEEKMMFRNEMEIIWNEALKGNLYTAMKLNAMTNMPGNYLKIVKEMLKAHALSVTVSGSSIVALVRDRSKVEGVAGAAGKYGDVILTNVNNSEARILSKERKIVKTTEFLKICEESNFEPRNFQFI